MAPMHLIGLAIQVSIFLLVLSLGLEATRKDALSLFRDPGLLGRSLLSMNILMPIAALLIGIVFSAAPEVRVALLALSLSPVPPILPNKELKAGGSHDYAIGLLVAASVAAIVLVPLGLSVTGALLDRELGIAPSTVVVTMLKTVLVPLALGMLARAYAPHFAARVARPVKLAATILLVVAAIPILIFTWSAMLQFIGDGLILGLIAFTLVGLAFGHWLGGPDANDRTVLALATSARHPGLAIAIASLNFPDLKGAMVVVIYHLIIGGLVAIPYVRWRKRDSEVRAHPGLLPH